MNKRPTNRQLESMVSEVEELEPVDCLDDIMDRIDSGRTKMRARWLVFTKYFGLRTTWVIVVLSLASIININLFIINRGPQWEFLEFGASGWGIVAKQFPFGWMALGMGMLVFAIIAMKHFSWSYKLPFRFFVAVLIGGVFITGGIAFATGINDALYKKLVEDPNASDSLLAKVYCLSANTALHSPTALIGEVMYVDPYSMIVQTPQLEVVTIAIDDRTIWPGFNQINRFDVLKMVGNRENDIFFASVIKKNDVETMSIVRTASNCTDRAEYLHNIRVAEQRREAVVQPITPAVGTVQLIKSIY